MTGFDAVRAAAAAAGLPLWRIGREMGHGDAYVSSGAARGSSPRCDTMARMLAVCGWQLVAMPADAVPDGAIVIDVPED